jgi:hypothetical protein
MNKGIKWLIIMCVHACRNKQQRQQQDQDQERIWASSHQRVSCGRDVSWAFERFACYSSTHAVEMADIGMVNWGAWTHQRTA